MSELNQEPQGEQPADDALETAGNQPPVDTAAYQAEIENLNPEDLAKVLGFDVTDSEPAEPDDDEPAPPAQDDEQPAEDEQGEQPAADEGKADDGEGEEGNPEAKPVSRRRLSVAGLPDTDKELNAKAIALVRDGKAANLFEAMKSLVGEDAAAAGSDDDAGQGDDAPDAPESPPTLDELKGKIASLREERRQAKADFDTDEEIRLTEEIEDLQISMLRAEQAEVAKQGEVADYQAEYGEAVTEMEEKYAELLDDENSPFADLLEDRIEAAKARRDPALADPRHVLRMAEELAGLLQGSAPKPKERTPIADPPRKAPVGAGVAPAGKVKAQLTKSQAEKFIEKAPQETLAAALWGD